MERKEKLEEILLIILSIHFLGIKLRCIRNKFFPLRPVLLPLLISTLHQGEKRHSNLKNSSRAQANSVLEARSTNIH